MKVDVSKIKDPGLATAVYNLGIAVERKINKPKWQPRPRQSRDRNHWLVSNGSQELARATQVRDAARLGEKTED